MKEPLSQHRYLALLSGVVLTAFVGYFGYLLYPRFDLPAVDGVALLALAAAAGIASFFSPCSFPLLVTLLAGHVVGDGGPRRGARPAVFGGALALGAAIFMVMAGSVVAVGGDALFAGVTFTSAAGITIRAVVGVILILLGLMQVGILPLSMHSVSRAARPLVEWQARLRRQRPVLGFAIFGFAYVLAGFG